jgi:hypothetical protein
MRNIVILRTPHKVPRAFFEPAMIPGTGRYPACVRKVDANGDMILSREDIESGKILLPANQPIEVYDGMVLDLDDELQGAQWEAIKHHKQIAKSRNERDSNGDLVIDGNAKRYGTADWYVEVPGQDAKIKNTTRRKKVEAQNYVINDTAAERQLKAKVLGKNTRGMLDDEVEDFLMQEASKNPQKIIDIYTGGDMQLRLLFIKAKEDGVIVYKDKLWLYGEIILGTSEDATILWMKQEKNKHILQLLKQEVYPHLYTQKEDVKTEDAVKSKTKNKE